MIFISSNIIQIIMLTLKEAVTIPKKEYFGDYEPFINYKLSKEAEAEIKKNEAKNAKLPKIQQKFAEIRNKYTSKLLEKFFQKWQSHENKFILDESSDEYQKRWTNELWEIYQKQMNKINSKFDNYKFPTNPKWNSKITKSIHMKLVKKYLKIFYKFAHKWEKDVIKNEAIIFKETYRKDKIIAEKRKKAKEAAEKLKAAKKRKLYLRKKRRIARKTELIDIKKDHLQETRDIISLVQTYSLYILALIICFSCCFAGFIYLKDVKQLFNELPI